MTKCKKCNVFVDTPNDFCPLCDSKIDACQNSTYPVIEHKSTWNFVKRLLLFIVVSTSIIVLLLNYTLTPNIRWAPFVVAGILSMCLVFLRIIRGRKRVLGLMFSLCFLIITLTIFWDYFVGYRGWSVNYVFPSICICYGIFLIILRIVSYFAFRANSTYIYLNILLEFVPLILFYKELVTFKPLAIISAVLGIVNLLILLVFDTSRLKEDLAKNLHI